MTVQELIDLLEVCAPDAEVRLAIQPHYPLEGGVAGVVTETDLEGIADEDDDIEDKVFLAIDIADKYAPDVWKALE